MSLETELTKQDLLSLWRQYKSEREVFLQARDHLYSLMQKLKTCGYAEKADATEISTFADTETKLKAMGAK